MDDNTIKTKGQCNSSQEAKTDNSNCSATMATMTTIPTQVTAAAALMLANSGKQGTVSSFFTKSGGTGKIGPGGRPPSGGGGSSPSGGGSGPGGLGFGFPIGPPGGGGPPGRGGNPAQGGGGGKLCSNPPTEFDGDQSKAKTFMNEFSLYRMANIDAEQMMNPMKRTALMLSFIKGPSSKTGSSTGIIGCSESSIWEPQLQANNTGTQCPRFSNKPLLIAALGNTLKINFDISPSSQETSIPSLLSLNPWLKKLNIQWMLPLLSPCLPANYPTR